MRALFFLEQTLVDWILQLPLFIFEQQGTEKVTRPTKEYYKPVNTLGECLEDKCLLTQLGYDASSHMQRAKYSYILKPVEVPLPCVSL